MAPTFSIVIPCYNRAYIIGRAIQSCLDQTLDDFEILISDDERSADHLSDVVAAFDDPRIHLLSHRGTGAAGRNRGIDAARGQYIAFLDSDDAFLRCKLEISLQHLMTADDRVYYSQVYADRGVGRLWLKPARGIEDHEDLFEYLFVNKGWIPMSTVVLPALFAKQTRFNENLPFAQDIQFAIDLWKRSLKFQMMNEVLVVCADSRQPDRVSQNAFFASSRETVEAYLAWLAEQRDVMSEKAYVSCCASVVSRLVAKERPIEAFQHIWRAYSGGAMNTRRTVSQGLQTFAPTLYWVLSNAVARIWGLSPPPAVEILLEKERARVGYR